MAYEKLREAMRRHEFAVSFFANKEQAAAYLNEAIDGQTVGFGDSLTLAALGLYELLATHNQVHDPMHPPAGQTFQQVAVQCFGTDIYLLSVNGLSETGEMVNIDGTGNRVAASLFGHQKVYFVVGTNKIEPTLERAIWRARNIAAPQNAKRHGKGTPCSIKADKCYDCSAPGRICNGLVVYWNAMNSLEDSMRCAQMEVVLIDEPLGL